MELARKNLVRLLRRIDWPTAATPRIKTRRRAAGSGSNSPDRRGKSGFPRPR